MLQSIAPSGWFTVFNYIDRTRMPFGKLTRSCQTSTQKACLNTLVQYRSISSIDYARMTCCAAARSTDQNFSYDMSEWDQ